MIALAAHCLEELGLEDFEIHIGNLGIIRGILDQAQVSGPVQDQIMALIDKGEVEELKKFLTNVNLEDSYKNILLELIGLKGHREVLKEVEKFVGNNSQAINALQELSDLLDILDSIGFSSYTVNLGIARGLDYYSGTVFEIYVHGLGAQKQISGGGPII